MLSEKEVEEIKSKIVHEEVKYVDDCLSIKYSPDLIKGREIFDIIQEFSKET